MRLVLLAALAGAAACTVAPPRGDVARPADDPRAVAAAPIALPSPDAIVLLHTNDVHGHLRPRLLRIGAETVAIGGAAARATFIRRWYEAAGGPENVLLVDAGDIFQGTPEGGEGGGRLVIESMNRLGYDAAAAGNHEFDLGIGNLEALAGAARFPLLAANLRDRRSGRAPAYVAPTWTTEVRGVRIAVVGATTEDLPKVTDPDATRTLLVLPVSTAVREAVRRAEAGGADLVIAVTHIGAEADSALARAVPGLDLIVGGHSHTLFRAVNRDEVTGVPVVQAGWGGTHVGEATFRYDSAADRIVDLRWRAVPIVHEAFPPDADEESALAEALVGVDRRMDEVVGMATGRFWRAPRGETPPASPMGIWMAEVYRRTAGAEIGFMNTGGVRDELEAGPVRLRDLYGVAPFGNTIVSLELTGAEIAAILEASLAAHLGGDAATPPAVTPLEVAGATVWYDAALPPGRRVVQIVLDDGEVIDPRTSYRVATNSFLAGGGDGYPHFLAGRDRRETGVTDLEAFRRAFAAGPQAPPEPASYRAVGAR